MGTFFHENFLVHSNIYTSEHFMKLFETQNTVLDYYFVMIKKQLQFFYYVIPPAYANCS